jgi:hypothetical protein
MDGGPQFLADFPTKCEYAPAKWVLYWCVLLCPVARYSESYAFRTEFELGLELDSAEVRGILLYEGQEWGRVVFDFLN